MKISACLIAREPSAQLDRAIASVRPLVDEIVVVFNGPILKVPAIEGVEVGIFRGANAQKRCHTTCGCVKGDLLDFSSLRNRSFSLATGDWLFWLDSDDELEFQDANCLRQLASRGGKFRYGFRYDYGGTNIWNVRLVPRTCAWSYPVHEVLISENFGAEFNQSDAVVIHHRRDAAGEAESVKRNLRIALHHSGSQRWGSDARFQYYLAQSHRNLGQFAPAIEAYGRCLSLSGVPDEKYLCAEWICKLYISQSKYYEAAEWAHRAIHGWPERANGFLLAGTCYYHLAGHTQIDSYWHIAVRYFRMGFDLPVSGSVIPMDDADTTAWEAGKLYSLSLNRVGDVKRALEIAEEAMRFRPDEQTRLNALIYRAYLLKEKSLAGIRELSLQYGAGSPFADNYVKETLVEIQGLVPSELKATAPAIAVRTPVRSIAFICAYQWLPWNPSNPPGGSEIAVVELSKRFAKRGYDVSVFTDPLLGEPQVYDGVKWTGRAYSEDPSEEFDLLIGWRGLDRVEGGRAKRRVLWLHDMHLQHVTPKRVAMVDAVVVNSMWHADQVRPSLPGKRIEILGAGLDPSRFSPELWPKERHRNWCVWASSWDRGLDFLLDLWPTVRKYELSGGEAELHVLYGCDGSLNMARKNGDKAAEEKFLGWKALAEATEGVVLHGRVPNDEYDSLLMRSGIWAYPIPSAGNSWGETFGVTACDSLCAGLRIVLSPRGALAEVASPSAFRQVYGKREDESYRIAFAEAIVEAMDEQEDGTREFLAAEARARFDWDRVADRWEERILK